MFAKTKCFMVLRSGRLVQSRSIRKSTHFKYTAESLSSSVRRNRSTHTAEQESGSSPAAEGYHLNDEELQFGSVPLVHKKAKLDELIRRAEELLGCRFYRSRTSPIGVGLSDPEAGQEPVFNLMPEWVMGENSMVMSRIPALIGSGHPILNLRQNVDPDDKEHALRLLSNNIQWRAFVILLVAKAFSHPRTGANFNDKQALELEGRIKTLAEITEMMHFAFSMHRTVIEIKHSADVAMEEKESSLQLGNKIAILFGDLLLSRTSKGLSFLKHHKVTEYMSDAISDFTESEILRRRHYEFFEPVLRRSESSGAALKELISFNDNRGSANFNQMEVPSFKSWKARVNLDIASLIGRSCLCSTLLSQLDEGANNLAFIIGRQIGFVIQAYNDLESYTRGTRNRAHPSIDLCTLPVVFHLNNDSVERIRKPVDISEIYRGVMDSPDALLKSQNTLEHLKAEAIRLISVLPRSTNAPDILKEFVVSLS